MKKNNRQEKIILSERCKLCNTNHKNHYLMYFDGKILGKEYEIKYGYTSNRNDDSLIDTYCQLSEIKYLNTNDLPENIVFNFVDLIFGKVDSKESEIHPQFTLASLKKEKEQLSIEFWFRLDLTEYKGERNPIKFVDEFYFSLLTLDNVIGEYNKVEEEDKIVGFQYLINIESKTTILKEVIENTINTILIKYGSIESSFFNNPFEAIFTFPEQYQSILKPYLLYFEEFLNDLCIETNVNIQKVGLDTILSVEPKNKDEALEKIADALKAYLCAPVMANGLSLEESLEMKTALLKLYAQCKNLESQMVYKEITLKEQNKQIELKDNIINESKRVLVEAGVDTNIITQNNTLLLESLQSIKMNNQKIQKKTFLNSIKAKINIPTIFNGSLEIKRDKL